MYIRVACKIHTSISAVVDQVTSCPREGAESKPSPSLSPSTSYRRRSIGDLPLFRLSPFYSTRLGLLTYSSLSYFVKKRALSRPPGLHLALALVAFALASPHSSRLVS